MIRLLIFLLINFGALGIGGLLLGNPATNQWYQSLNKAPWTPAGWVFGAAWTTIMLCYSVFMWHASGTHTYKTHPALYWLFALQFLLNVMWNPIFFRWHMMGAGLIVISALTLLVAWFAWWGFSHKGTWGLLMLPYLIWLIIATTLNGYAYFNN
ncbi:TspO protein [Chitinophagaceae bacterium IBVUCB1]|nr:TspO protein [Chitinophagaceae bacterium IBVUCB1]